MRDLSKENLSLCIRKYFLTVGSHPYKFSDAKYICENFCSQTVILDLCQPDNNNKEENKSLLRHGERKTSFMQLKIILRYIVDAYLKL